MRHSAVVEALPTAFRPHAEGIAPGIPHFHHRCIAVTIWFVAVPSIDVIWNRKYILLDRTVHKRLESSGGKASCCRIRMIPDESIGGRRHRGGIGSAFRRIRRRRHRPRSEVVFVEYLVVVARRSPPARADVVDNRHLLRICGVVIIRAVALNREAGDRVFGSAYCLV